MKKVILASASPRRKELLANICADFLVVRSNGDERPQGKKPSKIVEVLATDKAKSVAITYPNDIVIGADTIVVLDGEILGKPHDEENAFKMLKSLSGRTHKVYTGVCIVCGDLIDLFYVVSKVTFFKLSQKQIENYIKTGSPFDKAGGYGIQDSGFVSKIVGSYTNVMGLPLEELKIRLEKFLEENNE